MAGTRKNARWHHHPELPIPVSPVLSWPPRPASWLKWIARYWLAISSITIELALAFAVYRWFQPDWTTMKQLEPGWIFLIWLRNMVLLTLIAGGLHIWFITLEAQGKKLKFDARDQAVDSGKFTFRNQVWDNMFWSYASGVTAWTIWEVLYFWAAANGIAPRVEVAANPLWFFAWFVIIPVWSSFHFYWIHRFLHWSPMYRLVHHLHHRNVNIGPWAGISMHPVETFLYFSSVAIHFIIPSHALHVLFHFYLEGLNPAFSHSGFEAVQPGEKRRVNAGDFFHQLHHRYFECNYGTAEMPWDRIFGSFNDGCEDATAIARTRKPKRGPSG